MIPKHTRPAHDVISLKDGRQGNSHCRTRGEGILKKVAIVPWVVCRESTAKLRLSHPDCDASMRGRRGGAFRPRLAVIATAAFGTRIYALYEMAKSPWKGPATMRRPPHEASY